MQKFLHLLISLFEMVQGVKGIVNLEYASDCFEENFSALFENSETVPDSFFCFSDMVAFDVIYRLEKMGIKNAQVIGFDDIQKEVRIPKRLISVGTDKRAMAQRAVNVLVSRIEEGRGPRVSDMFGVYLNGDILS